MTYYPINLNLEGKPCLVIGGGEVAERKVLGLLRAGAQVKVISPQISPALARLRDRKEITVEQREYRRGDLQGMFLVFGAADDRRLGPELDQEARDEGCLINHADLPSRCDFILPALLEQGRLQVAVSSSGRCPALAQWLRDQLQEEIGPEYEQLVDLLGDFRDRLLTRKIAPPTIRRCIREILEAGLLEKIRSGGQSEAEEILRRIEKTVTES